MCRLGRDAVPVERHLVIYLKEGIREEAVYRVFEFLRPNV